MNRNVIPAGTPGQGGPGRTKSRTAEYRCSGRALPDDEYFILDPYAIRVIDPVLAAWAVARGTLP